MNIITPNFEIWEQEPGLKGVYKQIERAGRVCYRSENNITPESAKPFVERMINSKHFAMLEHGTVYLYVNKTNIDKKNYSNIKEFYCSNKYSVVVLNKDKDNECMCITTNLRVLAENDKLDHLKYVCEPTDNHQKRVTVHFTTQIAVTREYNRHRTNSMAEQSTRYCNYSKDKFNNQISINKPTWVDDTSIFEKYNDYDFISICKIIGKEGIKNCNLGPITWWWLSNKMSEIAYLKLIELGKKPQEARVVLPLDTNTELVHTAFVNDWKHFFDLRAFNKTGAAHPDAEIIAKPLYDLFVEKSLL